MTTKKKTKTNKDFNTLTHDELFRKMLELPEVAKTFVQHYIPEHIVSQIDLNTLESSKDTFIEEGLKKSLSDVLFKVQFNGTDGYLYLLLEHQSKSDHWMSFRLLKYIVNILDHHKSTHPDDKKLPPVYATVFYNGKQKYNAPLKPV